MDAHKALITNIFNGATLIEIPFFQRTYVWKEDLWQRLNEDMEFVVKTGKPHFFGSIILKEGSKPQHGDKFTQHWIVVDGQQRLTTFIIFLKVLCLKLNQTIFDFQFRIVGKKIALQHGRNDVDAFEKVVSMKSAIEIVDSSSKSRVIDAYNYFLQHIDENKLDIMTIMMNTQFVRIDLDANEDEQQIFDTINSLGVNLTTSELLKNYFFSRNTINEYEAKWVSAFEKDDDTKAYWDKEIETGRVKRAMIDIFFDAYFQIFIQDKKYNISNEDKLMYSRVDHLAQSYQHFIKTYCNGDKNVVTGQLKDYACCFMQTFSPEQCQRSVPASYGIERINIVIFGLKNTTLIPYVLFVAKNVYEQEERDKIYGILESYIMRRIVARAMPKNYNNFFTSLILNRVLTADALLERLRNANDATTYIPNDAELLDGFKSTKLVNLQSKGVLYLIESGIQPASVAMALFGFDNYSLEHLMPKKWRNNWPACGSEEEARKRDSVLLTLGNLAIITQSLNASIRDAEWETKKNGKGSGKPGLLKCASGLQTLQDVLAKDTWTESEIFTRAEWLYEKAKVLWQL